MSEKKPFYKKWWVWAIAIFVIGAANSDKDAKPVTSETKEVAVKQEVKPEAEPKKIGVADQKKAFEEKIKPEFERLTKKYDEIWKTHWSDTMTSVGTGKMNNFDAYDQMVILEKQLDQLADEFHAIEEVDIFTKEQKEQLEDYKTNMFSATQDRMFAAEDMKNMINESSITPEKMNQVKSWIKSSDVSMMQGLASYMGLASSLGVEIVPPKK